MLFEPDIIVTGPDASDVALVVEVKASARRFDDSEHQLKDYMAAVSSPVGMLVTPEKLRIYRDRYLPSDKDSITTVAEFDLNNLLRFHATENHPADALGFARVVQSWLEGLSTESGLRELSPEFRRAVQLYILPALAQGSVRSGHPRTELKA